MKHFLRRIVRLQTIRDFYVYNCETLFKKCKKPLLISQLLLIVEYYNVFALSINETVIDKFQTHNFVMGQLGYVSLGNISKTNQEMLIYVQIAEHATFLLLVLGYFLHYCSKAKRFMKNPILTFFIQTYNAQMIPGFYFSAHVGGIAGYVNLSVGALMAIFYFLHSHNNYYKVEDFSSRKQDTLELFKYIILFLLIIILNHMSRSLFYLAPLAISVIGIGQFLMEMPFYNDKMCKLQIQLNVTLLVYGILVMVHVIGSEEKWLVQALLCVLPICFICGTKIYQTRKKSIYLHVLSGDVISKIRDLSQNIGRNSSRRNDENKNKISAIEYVARNMLSFNKADASFRSEKAFYLGQIETQAFDDKQSVEINPQQKLTERLEKQFIVDTFLTEKLAETEQSLHSYLCALYESYFAQQKSVSMNDYGYLFYLLEESRNFPKLLVRIAEIKRRRGGSLNLDEESALNYLMREQQDALAAREENESSSGQGSDHDDNEINNKLDFNSIFIYESKLSELSDMIMRCTSAKLEILKCIGQDNIQLQKLRNFGLIFSTLRAKIEQGMHFALMTCGISIELEVLANYFCESLCQDQLGFQERMKVTFRRSVFGQGNAKNIVIAKQTVEQHKLFRRNLSVLMDELHMRQKGLSEVSCVIFVSLMIDTLGRIRLTSNQFKEMIGYAREDIVGRNVSSLMPQFIGDKHNQMLKAYIERGALSERSIELFKTSLFAIHKNGFCFPIEIETQIHIDMVSGDAGLLSQIWPSDKQEEALIIVNLQQQTEGLCQIDCCSEKIFRDIFTRFCDSMHTLKKSSIDEYIPIFSHFLLSKLNPDDAKIRSFDLSTIGFFPKRPGTLLSSNKSLKVKNEKKLNSVKESFEFGHSQKRRQFNLTLNDIYIIDITVNVLNDQPKGLRMGSVKFRAYRQIENEDEKQYMLYIRLAPQFEELCGYDRDNGSLINFLEHNHSEKMAKILDQSLGSYAFKQFHMIYKNSEMISKSHEADYDDQEQEQEEENEKGVMLQGDTTQVPSAQQVAKTSNVTNSLNIYEENQTVYDLIEKSQPITSVTEEQIDYTFNGKKYNSLGVPHPAPSTTAGSQVNLNNSNITHQNKKQLNQIKSLGVHQKKNFQFSQNTQQQQQQQQGQLHQSTEAILSQMPMHQGLTTNSNLPNNTSQSNQIYSTQNQTLNYTRRESMPSDLYNNLIGTYSKRNVEEMLTNSQENIYAAQGSYTGRELLPGTAQELKQAELFTKMKRRTGDLSEAQVSSSTPQGESGHSKVAKSVESKVRPGEKMEQVSVTGSRTTNTNEYNKNMKKVLIQKIKKNGFSPLALKQMQIMVLLFIITSIGFVAIEQIMLSHYFDLQQRAFSFITWCLNWRNTLNQISKEVVVGWNTAYPPIQTLSNADNAALAATQVKKCNNLLISLISQLSDINQEPDPDELVVLNQLLIQNSTFATYKTYTVYQNYTYHVIFHMFWLQNIQWQRITFPLGWLPIYDYDQNFPKVTVILTGIQGMQQNQVNSLYDTISSLVSYSLVVISIIAAVVFFDVIVVYALIQAQAERVLKLFATYDSEHIQSITDATQEQWRVFVKNASSLHLNSNNNSTQLQPSGGHVKDYVQLQRIICQKKKIKISQTTSLSKFNLRLVFAALLVFGILIVQPIANIVFTNQQIDQSKLDTNLLGQIELARATLVTGTVIPYYYVDKIFFFARNPYPLTYYGTASTRIFPYNSTTFTNLTSAVQQQRSQNSNEKSEYESFFFRMMLQNACTPYQDYPDYFTVIKSVDDCLSIQQGIFKNGLLTSLQTFVDIFLNLKAALVQSDATVRYNMMLAHFQKFTIYEIERVFSTIIDVFAAGKRFIVEKNRQFSSFTQDIQILLMVYELIMIVLCFFFFLITFLIQMRNQLKQAILVLSVFEIDAIFQNTYILHFLQQI